MELRELIAKAAAEGASDIHLVFGLPPKYRRDGLLEDMDTVALSKEACERYAQEMAGEAYAEISKIGELDLAKSYDGVRVRINLFRQQGSISAAIRLLSSRIPQLEALGLPPVVAQFSGFKSGMVIVTGETGSGKSTTLAALLDQINHTRKNHIITLEDPIEYVYTPDQSVINQREIGNDTESYAQGLKSILREDPDVILIGEMRDLDTIETALTAAETGHLVFATLHTNSAPDAIDRMVDVFPEGRQKQIRMQISTCLQAVLSQQLLRKKDGHGRVAACEVMMVNAAIRNLIREGKTPQIANVLATSASEGSITMDNMLLKLFNNQVISAETAQEAAREKEYIKRYTKG
jgi:twitching motility protein PilT